MNGEIKEDISLSDYLGKYLVLFWYPMDFTFVCPTEINAFNDALEEFEAINCELIAASCDSGKKKKGYKREKKKTDKYIRIYTLCLDKYTS